MSVVATAILHRGPERDAKRPNETGFPHGWTALRHQLFKINVELDWFEKYVNNRTYTWATPPDNAPASGSNNQ